MRLVEWIYGNCGVDFVNANLETPELARILFAFPVFWKQTAEGKGPVGWEHAKMRNQQCRIK